MGKNKIKAAFFDIDGTLVSFNTHEIPASSLDALKRLREAGVRLFIASGRHIASMDKITPHADLFDGYVMVNGALCKYGDKIVYSKTMTKEDVRLWLEHLKKEPRSTCFVLENDIVINFIDEQMEKVFEILDFPIPQTADLNEFADSDVYQMIISFTEDEDSKILPIFPECYAPRWSPLFSDIIPNGVNKMVGIEKMIKHLGITKDEVAAFGDGGNDIEMIESVGYGIAMGNACDELKKVAKFTTDEIDNDGLAKAVNRLFEEGFI